MAVSFVGSSTAGSIVATDSLSISAPSGVQAGDALVLVATLVSPGDLSITTPPGWTAHHKQTAPHAQGFFTKEATGTAADNVTLTGSGSGAFCATMCAYRGIDPDEWQANTSSDSSSPFTSGEHDPSGGALVCAFSMQNNTGTRGLPTEWVGLDGNLRAFAWGGRASFHGGTNGIIDKLNVNGAVSVTVQTTGLGERGSSVQWLELVNTAVLPEEARIRSHVSEDAGSLFQATQAVAVENAISEAFPYDVTIPAGEIRPFREAFTPDEIALTYYPIPTRNQEMLSTVEGETNLGRMARTYPGPIVTRVADIPGHTGDTMTAQEAISYIFSRWAEEFPWFEFEPVPDLRLLVPEAVADPRQYYIDNPEAGVLTTEAIVIPQDGDDRRTMRDLIDEWLSIFPGTIVRQNSSGRIELVPRVGPDAPDGPAVTLAWRDVLSMSDGEDDPRGVVNRARVTSQGWEWRENVAVVPPLYVLATRSDGLTPAAMQEVTDGLTAEPLANGAEREFEVFVEPGKPLDVDVVFSAWSASNPSGTGGLLEEVTLPLSFTVARGQTRTLEFSWFMFGVDNEKTLVYVARTERGLQVRVLGDRYRFGPNPFMGTRYVAYLVEVTAVTGTAWTRSNEAVTAEFSLANGDFVPGPGGANALATSTALYGEREATIRSDVFQLTPEQAQAVAQGYVLFNINPRTVREVRQSEWNRYPVKFDHVGRLVDLPNGERAVVENRSYSDSFAPDGGFMQSTFTATVQEVVIDTTTEHLHLDNGDYMRLDDGSLVEAS